MIYMNVQCWPQHAPRGETGELPSQHNLNPGQLSGKSWPSPATCQGGALKDWKKLHSPGDSRKTRKKLIWQQQKICFNQQSLSREECRAWHKGGGQGWELVGMSISCSFDPRLPWLREKPRDYAWCCCVCREQLPWEVHGAFLAAESWFRRINHLVLHLNSVLKGSTGSAGTVFWVLTA